ncbi:MAG: pilus assembly protein [Anaerolineae bacterium]|nr:pilus assembly protein [Anaerolineae bacterium]
MQTKTRWQQKGQSLVEVAIFLPVALIIIAGLVELSLYLVTQNKVNTATREAARFGANGGENAGMVSVALNTVTQTLKLEIDQWDLWSVRGRVRARCLNGTNGSPTLDFGPNDQNFTVEHSYGISQTVAFTETNSYVFSPQFRQDVMNKLVQGGTGTCQNPSNPAPDINNLEFVAMYSAHDIESILGLDVFLERVFTVRALHVFRVTSVVSNNQTAGCDAFPLALRDDVIRSVDPATYAIATGWHPVNQRYPAVLPTYAQLVQQGHVANNPLQAGATEGDVFLFLGEGLNVSPAVNYAWLQWNTDSTCTGCNQGHTRLRASMTWPGNSTVRTPVDLGFHEVGNWPDTELSIGDRVAYSNANGSAVSDEAAGHIDRRRTLRVIMWREHGVLQGGGPGNSDQPFVRVAQFANVRLLGYQFVSGETNRWLLVQFVSYDTSCGQTTSTP